MFEINSQKIPIPIKHEYLDKIKELQVQKHIRDNIVDYVYQLSVDKHIFIDGKFVIGIECKAYAENAMIKRILIDFELLRTQYPDLSCYLFQLEASLAGIIIRSKNPSMAVARRAQSNLIFRAI